MYLFISIPALDPQWINFNFSSFEIEEFQENSINNVQFVVGFTILTWGIKFGFFISDYPFSLSWNQCWRSGVFFHWLSAPAPSKKRPGFGSPTLVWTVFYYWHPLISAIQLKEHIFCCQNYLIHFITLICWGRIGQNLYKVGNLLQDLFL